jgi:hypothetical protein
MPAAARTLEQAATEGWPASQVAKVLKVELDEVPELAAAFDRARQIVDAEIPAELFRNAVRFSIPDAINQGFNDAESIESLVTQICYRAADLAFVLKARGETLSRYSRHLRKESDAEYYEGYFDEPEE